MNNINDILKLASVYENRCTQDLVSLAKIRKMPDGRYRVLSQTGKNLGTYKSRKGAERKEKQVEYHKHLDKSPADDEKSSKPIDLTKIDEFAYSAIMRQLRQQGSPEQVRQFLVIYKREFDKGVKAKIHKPERVALQNTVLKFHKLNPIKLDKKVIKLAAVAELGNAEQVGKYLSDIVKFILGRVPTEKQPHAIQVLKQKFATMSENEISGKSLPQAATYGQAITFVKHVLFNHDAHYIRDVLNSLSRNL